MPIYIGSQQVGFEDAPSAAGRKVIYVSTGDAATDARTQINKYDARRPFATPDAAKEAAEPGDLISVEPGFYPVQTNLAKDGVNWFFHKGAEINLSERISDGISTPLFSDYDLDTDTSQPMAFCVSGGLKISCAPVAYEMYAIRFRDPSSSVVVELSEIDFTPRETYNPIEIIDANFVLKAGKIFNSTYDAFEVYGDNNTVLISVDEVEVYDSIVEFTGSGRHIARIGFAIAAAEGSLSVVTGPGSQVWIDRVDGNLSFQGNGTVDVGLINASDDDFGAAFFSTNTEGGSFTLRRVVATASQPAIVLGEDDVSIQGSVLIAGGDATYSIIPLSGTKAIKILGNVVANKTVNSDVTQQVGAVTVSADVL